MQRSSHQQRIQDIQTTRYDYDYEWLLALAQLYDEGWPTLRHSHECNTEAQDRRNSETHQNK
jgi:hypothetical protein